MENKVLQENLQAIKKYDEALANKILTTEYKKSNFAISKTQNDEYNLLFCNIPLHNQINAKEESENIAKNIQNPDDKNTIRIVYGLGLGYLVDEISNVVSDSNIILYEPNIDILKFVLEIAQIDAILKPNVFVATNKQELINLVNKLANNETKISITFLSSYRMLFEIDIMNVLEVAQKTIGEICARKNLEAKNTGALFFNFVNLAKIAKNPDISQLADIYKGKTAIIASAGSTLSENIETIKQNQEKAVIFAVNQSAKYLIENGVKPDFIVNIDVYDNTNHFKGINTEDYYFILEGFSHYKIFNLPKKKAFNYISEDTFFNYWLRDCFSIKHHLKSAGTVSISAFLSACLMGFEKIILVGQDLAYKNGKCYTQGTVAENLECVLENNKYVIKPKNMDDLINSMKNKDEEIENCKKRVERYLDTLNQNIYTVRGQNGNLLPTQTSYMYFIDYFTQFANILKTENPNMKLINSSIGGAQIDGFENIDLKTALKNEKNIEKLNLDNFEPDYDKNHAIKVIEELYNEIETVIPKYTKLGKLTKEILCELEKENKITDKTKSSAEEIIKTVEELKNYNKDKIVKCLIDKRMAPYIDLIDDEFYKNVDSLKNTMETMIKTKPVSSRFSYYKNQLKDCESLILK